MFMALFYALMTGLLVFVGLLFAGMDGIRSALTTLTAPKRIIRGPDGRAVGVEAVQQTLEFAPEMRPQ